MFNSTYSPNSLLHINSTGNTFIVDETPFLKNLFTKETNNFWKEKKIKNICNLHKVDGLAILFATNNHHLQWQFFNTDGSGANMCGNLARGLIYYLSIKSPTTKTEFSILGPNNIIQTGYLKKKISFISMPKGELISISAPPYLKKLYSEAVLKDIPKPYNSVAYICLGVPHALIPIYPEKLNLPTIFKNFFNKTKALKQEPLILTNYKIQNLPDSLQKVIKKIRNQNTQGFNVTLFNPKTLQTISFERGVENFTLSCGTGAAALAYYLKTSVLLYKNSTEITISMPGGDLLINVEKKEYLLGGKCKILSID